MYRTTGGTLAIGVGAGLARTGFQAAGFTVVGVSMLLLGLIVLRFALQRRSRAARR